VPFENQLLCQLFKLNLYRSVKYCVTLIFKGVCGALLKDIIIVGKVGYIEKANSFVFYWLDIYLDKVNFNQSNV